MYVSVSTEKKQPGKFWQGLLLSLAGWAVDVGLATLIFSWATFDQNSGENFWKPVNMLVPLGIILAVIWLPVGVVAALMSRKKGFKASLPIVLTTLIIAPLQVGCGVGMLAALYGRT